MGVIRGYHLFNNDVSKMLATFFREAFDIRWDCADQKTVIYINHVGCIACEYTLGVSVCK